MACLSYTNLSGYLKMKHISIATQWNNNFLISPPPVNSRSLSPRRFSWDQVCTRFPNYWATGLCWFSNPTGKTDPIIPFLRAILSKGICKTLSVMSFLHTLFKKFNSIFLILGSSLYSNAALYGLKYLRQ